MNHALKITGAIIILCSIVACSSSHIIGHWSAPDLKPIQNNNIVVVSLSFDTSTRLRKAMEQQMVSSLNALGYRNVSVRNAFDTSMFNDFEEIVISTDSFGNHFQTFISIELIDEFREDHFLPVLVTSNYSASYNDFFPNYPPADYVDLNSGVYITVIHYFWETDVYDVASKKIICSIKVESLNPESERSMARQYVRLITRKMLKQNILINLKKWPIQEVPPPELRRPF